MAADVIAFPEGRVIEPKADTRVDTLTRPFMPSSKATFRETAAAAWLRIDMGHGRTM
jgi:hypothetical protein